MGKKSTLLHKMQDLKTNTTWKTTEYKVVEKLIFAADTYRLLYDKLNLGWPHCTHCEPVWHKTSTAALSLTLALL